MKKELFKRILSSIFIIPVVFIIIVKGSFILNFFLFLCLCLSVFEWHNMMKKKLYYYLGIFFLTFSFYTAYKLYNLNNNYTYFVFVMLVCIFTDIGGYVFGNIFKGPKLSTISPNKTYAGAIGGFILAILSVFLFFKISYLTSDQFLFSYKLFLIAILISLVSQLGDIAISYFKRLNHRKDTGRIIPGHGGLLDRIDGMIFAFPFAYIILSTNFFAVL